MTESKEKALELLREGQEALLQDELRAAYLVMVKFKSLIERMAKNEHKVTIDRLTVLLRTIEFPKPGEGVTFAFDGEVITHIDIIGKKVKVFGIPKEDAKLLICEDL